MSPQTPDPQQPEPPAPDPHTPGSAAPDPHTTGPAGAPAPAPAPAEPQGFFPAIRRSGLYRGDQRWVGGVASGLAQRFGVDPLIVRGLIFVSFFVGGLGLIAYGVAWALLPEQRDGRIHLEETIRGRFDAALVGAAAFVVVGLARGDHWLGVGSDGWWSGSISFLVTVGVIVLIIGAARRGRTTPQQPGPYGPFPAPGAPTSGAAPASAPHGPGAGYGVPVGAATSSFATPGPSGLYGAAPAGRQPAPPSGPGYAPGYGPGYAPGYAPAPRGYAAPTAGVPLVNVPAPPRRRASGPGSAIVGVVVAGVLLTLATLMAVDRAGSYDIPVVLTLAGIATVLLGLGIVVSGLRGRRGGILSFFAIVVLLVLAPIGAGERSGWHWDDARWSSSWDSTAGDSTVAWTTRSDAASGYSLGMGDATVDLTEVPLTSTTLDVPLHVGFGNLTVLVPTGAAVTADVQAGAGDVMWDVDGAGTRSSGVGQGQRHYASDAVVPGTAPALRLDIQLGAGNITIEES